MLIHRRFVELSGGPVADIVVIPTASQLEMTGPDYNRIFRELGAGRVEFLPILSRADCEEPRYLEMLGRATGIFITGRQPVAVVDHPWRHGDCPGDSAAECGGGGGCRNRPGRRSCQSI